MEKIKVGKQVDKEYYLEKESDIAKLKTMLSFTPNFAIVDVKRYTNEDLYYETPDRMLKSLDNASIRIRKSQGNNTLSIICNQNGEKREFEMALLQEISNTPFDDEDIIAFLEDKINDIYAHRLDVDFRRKIKTLRVMMAVITDREEYTIINNSGTKIIICFDHVEFLNKRRSAKDLVLEIKLDCYPGKDNMFSYERFLDQLRKKVVLIPMRETKYEACTRVYNFVDMTKKELKEFKAQQREEKLKKDAPKTVKKEDVPQAKKSTFA